jgi:glycosyltransferase involved in cell wall biosynthesis
MHLIILTQYYPPEHGAPQNRLHDLAKRMVENGHNITILTAMPNYPKGKIFPKYKRRFTYKEEIEGVKVIRSWIFASKNKGLITQLSVYFSFVFSSIIVGIFRLKKADFLICESPPLFLGLSALILSFFKRSALIMNISDLWPESAVQLGLIGPGLKLSILEWFEKLLYKKSIFVMCQTEGIVSGVKKSYSQAKTLLFPNGVDLKMFKKIPADKEIAKELEIDLNNFIIGYGGNHGRSQALTQVLKAAKIITEKQHQKIEFLFFGDGPEKNALIKYQKEHNIANVRFLPSQPREKMVKIQSLWDIALVPLKDIEIFDGARPSKMFELMAGEIPFIFCGRGEGADIAVNSGCAIAVPPEQPKALADVILKTASMPKQKREQMGKKGRKFVTNNFNRKKLAEDLMNTLKQKH